MQLNSTLCATNSISQKCTIIYEFYCDRALPHAIRKICLVSAVLSAIPSVCGFIKEMFLNGQRKLPLYRVVLMLMIIKYNIIVIKLTFVNGIA